MRHRVAHRKLGRTSSHRLALLKNLSISLIKFEKIETTLPKAKELKAYFDKLAATEHEMLRFSFGFLPVENAQSLC